MITTILNILSIFVAWLIPHLIAKSSAFVLITFVTWYSILIIGLLWIWIWEMDIATLFLTLASVITRAWVETSNNSIANLSSFWIQSFRLFLHLLTGWKEKWLDKMLITLLPGNNSGWRGLKEEKTSLYRLSMLTTDPLINVCWYFVRPPRESECWWYDKSFLGSMSKWRIWFDGNKWAWSCDLPLSFLR